jgi:arsenite methyltransferase
MAQPTDTEIRERVRERYASAATAAAERTADRGASPARALDAEDPASSAAALDAEDRASSARALDAENPASSAAALDAEDRASSARALDAEDPASSAAALDAAGCCGPADSGAEVGGCGCSPADPSAAAFGGSLYGETDAGPEAARALEASLGCGVPTAVADLHEGETVLDLGSGGGADVLISARRVGPTGRAIGIDMTDEMLELARANAADAGVENAEFVKGYIEELPLRGESVDVVISNCVINLSADKRKVVGEVARVLRPGGRFAVSDVIADPDMDDETRADMAQWTGCVAGALTRDEFETALREAGLTDIEIEETHRVHEHAASAIVRARKPR